MESAGRTKLIVSVILPVRNEGKHISRVLDDLLKQDFPQASFEVLLVDGMSTDDTLKVASDYRSKFANFQILENPRRLASAARNIGFKASSGQYILYIDGHCAIPSDKLLSDMAVIFANHKVDVLCRPQPLTALPQTYFQQAVSLARASALGHAVDSTIYSNDEREVPAASSGAMYRRAVFDEVGPFDESFDACEDVEFNTRVDAAGLKALISPKLTVEYAARGSIRGLFRQLHRYGYGRWKLFLKHHGSLGLGTVIPVIFVLGLFALPFAWLVSLKGGIILSIPYLLYAVIVIAASFSIANKHRKSLMFALPIVFFVTHFAFGLGFIASAFHSQKR